MPTIGWALGRQFADYISNIDHWIVFILLAFIGGKMIYEALHEDEEQLDACTSVLDIKELFLLAIATSIDALAVGISFAFLGVEIVSSALLITATTFALSFRRRYNREQVRQYVSKESRDRRRSYTYNNRNKSPYRTSVLCRLKSDENQT